MRFLPRRKLGETEKTILSVLLEGWTLKSHRTLDGAKSYRLHPLTGLPQDVDPAVVARLTAEGLLQSNLKFPAATYLLTQKGYSRAQQFRQASRL